MIAKDGAKMIICVCGPTGVGKTKMSIELAKHFKAIVINCDAMQVYQGMNIGTAKITEEEKEGIPHYLFDIKKVTDDYSVYDYQKDVRKVIDEHKNQNIILVGGTGLYMKAALYDYEFAKEENKENYDALTNEELYELALKKDAKMEIHLNNRKRLIRFLNRETNPSNKNKLLYPNCYFIGLTTARETLYQKINERVDKMLELGLEDEVKNFYDQNINSKALQTAIGYKELYAYFNKEISREEAIALIKQKSRHYAKRQYTWYKHQMNVKWFDVNYEDFSKTIAEVIKYLEKENIS